MVFLHRVGSKLLVSGVPWVSPEMALESTAHTDARSGGLLSILGRRKQGKRSSADIEKRLIKQTGAVLVAGSVDMPVRGFLTKADVRMLGRIPAFSKLYTLAEVFSGVPNLPICAMLVVAVPDPANHYAMCLSVNGLPAADEKYDRVVSKDKVSDLIDQWTFEMANASVGNPVIFGTWSGANEMTLESVVAQSHGLRAMRSVGTDPKILISATALAAIIAGSGYGYQWYVKDQAAKQAKERAKKQDSNRVYNEALATQWPQQQWGSIRRVKAIQKQIGEIPPSLGGFRLTGEIVCSVADAVCRFSYKRREGTYTTFKGAVGQLLIPVNYGQDGMTVEVQMKVPNPPIDAAPDRSLLPVEDKLPLLFWPEIQSYPGTTVEGGMQGDYKLFPLVVGVNEAEVHDVVRSVTVSVSFPLWGAFSLGGASEMPPSSGIYPTAISWREIRLSPVQTGTKMTIIGDLYAKKSNG